MLGEQARRSHVRPCYTLPSLSVPTGVFAIASESLKGITATSTIASRPGPRSASALESGAGCRPGDSRDAPSRSFTFGRGLAHAIYPMKPPDFRNPERSLFNLDQLIWASPEMEPSDELFTRAVTQRRKGQIWVGPRARPRLDTVARIPLWFCQSGASIAQFSAEPFFAPPTVH
jgi:hypothetical protein